MDKGYVLFVNMNSPVESEYTINDQSEIDDILKKRNYCLPSHLYFKIVDNSSQICQVKYDAYSDKYSIHTDDGYHWEVRIYQE